MCGPKQSLCISGLVVECIVAIDVTRVRFPADAIHLQTTRARGVLAKAAIPGQPQMETDRRPLEARATGRSAAGVMFSFADLSWDLASLCTITIVFCILPSHRLRQSLLQNLLSLIS